jgi:putative N-acetyltransferase (TIGR04045 family)
VPTATVRAATRCGVVRAPRDLAAHHGIRLQIFVVEQAMFALDDSDEHDLDPSTMKVLAWHGATPAGCVRLYPLGVPGRWQGDRLAVLRPFRRHNVGAPLVRYAVATAASLGGQEMIAHVQVGNVAFFDRLGWRCTGPVEIYVGRPHRPMAIELAPYASADTSDAWYL